VRASRAKITVKKEHRAEKSLRKINCEGSSSCPQRGVRSAAYALIKSAVTVDASRHNCNFAFATMASVCSLPSVLTQVFTYSFQFNRAINVQPIIARRGQRRAQLKFPSVRNLYRQRARNARGTLSRYTSFPTPFSPQLYPPPSFAATPNISTLNAVNNAQLLVPCTGVQPPWLHFL